MRARATAHAPGTDFVLTPHPKRRDWYAIPVSWTPEVSAAPSVQLDPRLGPVVHRSHLPLLAKLHPEVSLFLEEPGSRMGLESDRNSDRGRFDAATEANGWKLRSYQHEGREFVRARRGTLLADQMRLGKTSQIVSSHEPDAGPLVVVAPLATREVWLGWFRRRWPDIRPLVLAGKQVEFVDPKKAPKRRKDRGYDVLNGAHFDVEQLLNAQLVFMNYDILAGWKNFGNRRIGTLVYDEIHLLSNKGSRRSKAAMFLAATAERVIGATGTPLWNKPKGLFTTLSCINPGAWGKYFEFASRYCDGRMGSHGFVADGSSHEEEFRARMQEVMIRRTWQSVLGQTPPIERTVEVVDITERQAFEVEKEAERVRNHATRSTAVGAMARFRRLLARLKIDGAIDVAKRVLDGGERVIVWTWHRDIALRIEDALTKVGYPGFVVTGKTGPDMREEILNRWREYPHPAPLCITLAVGQVGIDLSAARQEVFAELDFTPSIVAQAEMRPFTITQPIAATYVIIDHDIERKILEALQTKCDAAVRMGVPAAESAIEVITSAFSGIVPVGNQDDFAAIASAVLADHPDAEDEGEHDYHGSLWTFDWEAG